MRLRTTHYFLQCTSIYSDILSLTWLLDCPDCPNEIAVPIQRASQLPCGTRTMVTLLMKGVANILSRWSSSHTS